MDARIILISGACGTGKTTVVRLLAERAAAARAVHLHTDDFYGCIRKGYIPPWQAGSKAQNETASAAAAAAAEQFAAGGFEVYVDGVAVGGMKTNLSGKLVFSVELSEGQESGIRIVKR